VTGVTWQ